MRKYVQICCREKEKKENNDNCKACCVTRKLKVLVYIFLKTGDCNSRISLAEPKSTDSSLQNLSPQKDCFDAGYPDMIPRYPVTGCS